MPVQSLEKSKDRHPGHEPRPAGGQARLGKPHVLNKQHKVLEKLRATQNIFLLARGSCESDKLSRARVLAK